MILFGLCQCTCMCVCPRWSGAFQKLPRERRGSLRDWVFNIYSLCSCYSSICNCMSISVVVIFCLNFPCFVGSPTLDYSHLCPLHLNVKTVLVSPLSLLVPCFLSWFCVGSSVLAWCSLAIRRFAHVCS